MKFLKLALIGAALAYGTVIAWDPTVYRLIDWADLVFHEAGHIVFGLFGNRFLTIAGGSIMQLLIPALAVSAFIKSRQHASIAVAGIWLGQSFMNVSVYARDARTMDLQLITGKGVGHDWNNMLFMLDMLQYDQLIGDILYLTGLTVMICLAVWGSYKVITEPAYRRAL